jgi:thiol-disulfide isomerase/thioredoxin
MRQRSKFGLVWVGVGLGLAAILGVAFALWSGATRLPGVPKEGDMAKFRIEERPAVQLSVTDLTGKPFSLEEIRGKLVLVNFWATWCAPCVKELPTLVELQKRHGDAHFQVVTVSLDRAGANAIVPFFEQQKIDGLPVFLDQRSTSMAAFGLRGLPTTVLLGPDGREIGRLEGEADWSGEEAVALIEHYRQALAAPKNSPKPKAAQ